MAAVTDYQTVNIPHVHFLVPTNKSNPPLEKYDFYTKQKTQAHLTSKNQLDSRGNSKTEWSFTRHGMVELPAEILGFKGRSRNAVDIRTCDPRLHSVMEKGNWHRARNSSLRWNQASMFSQNPYSSPRSKQEQQHISSFKGKEGALAVSNQRPSAYEVSLRMSKGMLPKESARPVTGGPVRAPAPLQYVEQDPPRIQTAPNDSLFEQQVSVGVNTSYHNDISTDSQALLSVIHPPMDKDIPKAKLRYYEDESSRRRRGRRPRPKTSSAAFLPRKQSAADSDHRMQRLFHWSPHPMMSEMEMKRAYSSVTGEKIELQSRAASSRGSRTAGRADLGDTLGDPPIHKHLRIRALKSAPLASLLQRQQLPTSYTVGEDQQATSVHTPQPPRAATAKVRDYDATSVKLAAVHDSNSEDPDKMMLMTRDLKTR